MRVRARMVGLVAALVCTTALPAGAAHAAESDWYFVDGDFSALHQRADGSGIQVALIDSQIDPSLPDLASADLHVAEEGYCWDADGNRTPSTAVGERAAHGTSMVAMLVGNGQGMDGQPGIQGVAPAASVYTYSLVATSDLDEGEGCTRAHESGLGSDDEAFSDALEDGADIINMSGTFSVRQELIARAVASGVIVVASAGNERLGWIEYPAQYNGVVAVGAYGPDYLVTDFTPYGRAMGAVAPGASLRSYNESLTGYRDDASGSSWSSAYTSGVLAMVWSAYPNATANQILQLLVHNTGSAGGTHDPERDEQVGYGSVNARAMLADDPMRYSDTSPFVWEDGDVRPSAAEIDEARAEFGRAGARPTPEPTEDRATQESAPIPANDRGNGLVVGVVAAILVVLLAGIVTAVIAIRRRQSEHSQDRNKETE